MFHVSSSSISIVDAQPGVLCVSHPCETNPGKRIASTHKKSIFLLEAYIVPTFAERLIFKGLELQGYFALSWLLKV
ncbi:MAG TPA: hypothetical protein DCE42_13225 [Myxococcales bacterium]|nr:hypothetical protein [Deltaproteobacteria bacterium]HAA55718.1 hypothetical protein [Myxococcales bacterium]|tara:strand:+ start:94 stop:321 length:228 start_codon:yes stop_codon:yes gene_type:complete